jgi:hypothetical protein
MTKLSIKREPFRMLSLCALFFFIGVATVHAATYYVATTGSDSNHGTSASPWRNPQKCTAPPIQAGDTCLVEDGTYTDVDGNGLVVYAGGSSVQGTAGAPITIMSLNQYGAKIVLSGSNTTNNEGFHLTRNYYIIDGFDISGGTGSSTTVANHGIVLTGGTGVIIRNNKIHNIGRTVCSRSGLGYTGLFVGSGIITSLTIDSNIFASIGRLRVGESGCAASVPLDQQDHGMYIDGNGGSPGINGVTITRNLCYDTNRGYCIQFFGGAVTNATVWNNTFADGSPTGWPVGQIILGGTLNTADFKNNISHNSVGAPLTVTSAVSCSGITIDYTLTNNTDSDLFTTNHGKPACVTVGTHNHINTSPGFTDAGTRVYTLAPGSAAINAGTNVGVPVQDGATDIGAYEFGDSTTLLPLPPQNVQVH